MRPFRKGAGSYDLIVPKFQKFAELRHQDKYYVRGTFTHLQHRLLQLMFSIWQTSASSRSRLSLL